MKKIAFIRSYDKNYHEKLEKLMDIFWNNDLKYKFLLNTSYKWELLNILKPKKKLSKRTKEIQKALKFKKIKRKKRIEKSITTYEKQIIEEKDFKVWKILKWKIFFMSKRNPIRIYIYQYI